MIDSGMTIADAKHIGRTLLAVDRYPMFLGDRGTGKTQISFQISRDLQRDAYYLNCSQVDAESLVYPAIKEVRNGEVTNKAIDLITLDFGSNPTIVILDELTNARPGLQSVLLSLVADKKMGQHYFPNLSFIATGNDTTNSSLAQPLPRPLIERFCIVRSPVPTKEEWIAWMRSNHPDVPAYLYGFVHTLPKNMFHQEESKGGDVEDFKQIPSPRSHTYASSVLAQYPTLESARQSLNMLTQVFTGYLGDATASRFASYLQEADNFLTYDEYLKGKEPTNASQLINLLVDAADKLEPIYKSDINKFFARVDKLLYSVDTSKMSNLLQFAVVTLTRTDEVKYDMVVWSQKNPDAHLKSVLKHRIELFAKAAEAFPNSRLNL